MGTFADFYVVPSTEAGAAARSMGGSARWPHYHIKRVDVFQVAALYGLLRSAAGEGTWKLFEQRVEPGSVDEALDDSDGDDSDGPLFLVASFPADFTERLAGLSEGGRNTLAERWQVHPEFFWSRDAGTAAEVVGELCRLATLAVQRHEVVILAESGE